MQDMSFAEAPKKEIGYNKGGQLFRGKWWTLNNKE